MKPTGGGTKVTPVPPPISLFPGITGGLNDKGSKLGGTLASTLNDITSGTDMNQLFAKITAAQNQQTVQGTAALKESFAAGGMGGSTDMMRAITNYRQQVGAQLTSQLGQLGLEGEKLRLGGAEILSQLATSFAPSAVVTQGASGSSIFSQASSAGEAAMMLYLVAAACWIAESIYGKNDPRTFILRYWVNLEAPIWFRWFYLRYGERIAKTPLRWFVWPIFEFVLWRKSSEVKYARV